MEPVSGRFLQSLGYGQKRVTECTVTPYGADPITVQIVGGTLRCDSAQRIRRQVQSFEILGDDAVFDQVTSPGAIFRINAGLSYHASSELVPVFTGEAQSPRQMYGGGTISLTLVDNANWLSRCRFLTPYVIAAGVARVTAITAVVQFARPGTVVIDTSGDTSSLGAQQVWTENALDVVADLTTDASLEGFFKPDGAFLIRKALTTLTPAVWSILPGRGGTLKSLDRIRPSDRWYNTVVAKPTLDGTQAWTDQTASITDPTDPLYHLVVGVVPAPDLTLPTATTASQALGAAQTKLDQVRGRTESLLFGSISNPALDGGDVVRLAAPQVNQARARSWTHYIDSFDMDLVSGEMSGQTRAQVLDG